MDLPGRAAIHAALGDPHRLRMVDALASTDLTFQELAAAVGLPGNAAAHHLAVLEAAGLIARHASEGDRRRRYIRLRTERLDALADTVSRRPRSILFVCTHNSARSPFAAALWQHRTGAPAESAGSDPAGRVNPRAVAAARSFGVDLTGVTPRAYEAVATAPDLVISVCDRAREHGLPFSGPALHWSVPDPVRAEDPDAFRLAFSDLADRIDRFIATTRPN